MEFLPKIKVLLPLCFYINQALFPQLCIPNSAHSHVILLYNLTDHLLNKDSCEKNKLIYLY